MIAATSTGVVMFGLALIVISQSKAMFDLSLGAWIIDHTSFDARSRVIGLNETSWAVALLLGVSLMGLATAAAGWRAGFGTGAFAATVSAVALWLRVPREPAAAPHEQEAEPPAPRGRVDRTGWLVIAATLAMTGGSHCIIITFGGWLEDSFDFTPSGITAVVFCLGVVELLASVTSARRTDVWGKARSTAYGVGLMVPGALALVVLHAHLLPGLLAFAVMILGFEFAIVSVLGLGEYVVPGAPGRGLGLLFAAGTFGRALVTVPATALYEASGIGAAAVLAAALGAIAFASSWRLDRIPHT
jgi:predicted MFS family arabinose efflux permease